MVLLALATTIAPVQPAGAATAPVGGRFPTAETLVDQVYRDVFGRPADAGGLAYWSALVEGGVSAAAVYNALIDSPEFGGTVAPIARLYFSVFDRQPDLEGLRFWVERRRNGASLSALAEAFLESSEFAALGDSRSDEEIVAAVYGRVLGRPPDPDGLAYWTGLIASGSLTVPRFVATISESVEHRARRDPDVLVTTTYLGLLQRVPDPAGAAYWADRVRAGASLLRLISPIMAGAEYQSRFDAGPSPTVSVVADGFTIPWDVAPLPDGRLVVTERGGTIWLVEPDGSKVRVTADLGDLFASGETGLMGLAVDPSFGTNRRFFTCQGHSSPREIQVIAWTLSADGRQAVRLADPLLAGLPIGSGRHGGCQLEIGAGGELIVGTGDAATGSLPQNLASFGGKTLRVDREDGAALGDNPFAGSTNPVTARILSYGHRNVQGVAVHPDTGEVWTVEHGPDRDDEINRIVPGANYGWHPVPGYNERVPMTDLGRFPDAEPARYATGFPTLALSGATFLTDDRWGSWRAGLAVTALKNRTLSVFFFGEHGGSLGRHTVISGQYGRLRGVAEGPTGSIFVTTSNGGGNDRVLRIDP